MSTSSITPDQNATPAPPSVLGATVGQVPPSAPTPQAQPAPQGRLQSILQAVAHVGTTALAGIPDKGRPSFVTGLGEGARSEEAAQANQQAIRFKDFDNQVRLANLHNQDLELQQRTQEQQDAHQKAQDFQADFDESHGISHDPHPNDGAAVTQSLQAQTTANGSASIAPGTHLAADGKTINVPSDDSDTQAGLLSKYKQLAGVIPGIPAFPGMDKAQFVPAKNLDLMTHALQGFNPDGSPMSHDQLKSFIPALQSQRDALTKKNASPYQTGTLDNLIGIYQANEKNHSDAEDAAFAKQTQQKAAPEGAIEGAKAKAEQPFKMALQDNAASNKPQKTDTNLYVGTDSAGNQIAGTGDQLKGAGASGVTKLDADTGKKLMAARELISSDGLFNAVAQNLKDLTANGKIGTVASRWNDFIAGKVGSGDPDFQALRTNMGLLSTKLMQAHVGARGSHEMLEHFQNLADYRITDSNTLGAALKAEYRYVHGVAMLPKQQAQTGGQ